MNSTNTSTLSDWLVVIPARLGSTRLPEKPLLDLGGKPLLARTVENLAKLVSAGASLTVATDAQKIIEICQKHQIPAVLTRQDHPSGTDRCWEVARKSPKPFVLNVQGDEPFVIADDIVHLMQRFAREPHWDMGTLAHTQTDRSKLNNPAVVKVVTSKDRALYFSRAPIPWNRDNPEQGSFAQHLGVYVYRREALTRFCSLAQSPLEICERLEQLRALEAGMSVLVCPARAVPKGIDTQEDLEAARALYS